MAAHKGHVKAGGRQKGTPNKTTVAAREAYQAAFDGIGGVPHLTAWATENPTEFYKQFARLIPIDVNAKADVNGKLEITWRPPQS